jgi:hypothetical protein
VLASNKNIIINRLTEHVNKSGGGGGGRRWRMKIITTKLQ